MGTKVGTNFRAGQKLKAEELNLLVTAINDNADLLDKTKQSADNNTRSIEIINSREVDISDTEFESLKESGNLDTSKTYYIYEDES